MSTASLKLSFSLYYCSVHVMIVQFTLHYTISSYSCVPTAVVSTSAPHLAPVSLICFTVYATLVDHNTALGFDKKVLLIVK